jgi:hypothetical protein
MSSKKEIKFSENVNNVIDEVIEDKDVFDNPLFNPISYINEKFPNGKIKFIKNRKIFSKFG